jgi:hypothetical protein
LSFIENSHCGGGASIVAHIKPISSGHVSNILATVISCSYTPKKDEGLYCNFNKRLGVNIDNNYWLASSEFRIVGLHYYPLSFVAGPPLP